MTTCKRLTDILDADNCKITHGHLQCTCLSFQVHTMPDGTDGLCGGCGRLASLDAFFVDHLQGFEGTEDAKAWLETFADRFDYEEAAFDLAGRAITFGDIRKTVAELGRV